MRTRNGGDGQDGLSAYEVARLAGFRGSAAEWLRTLRGDQGPAGKEGPQGSRGLRGESGPAGAIGLRGEAGVIGKAGDDGRDGWTPILAVVEDGERRVHQVVRWIGGSGHEPESGWYIGPNGPVQRIAEAVDIRGPAGRDGRSGGMITSQSNAPSGIVTIPEVSSDPTAPGAGQTWVLYAAAEPAGTLSALFGAYPIVTDAEAPESFLLSYKSSAGIKRVALT